MTHQTTGSTERPAELVEGGEYDPRMGANMEPVGPLTTEHISGLEAKIKQLRETLDTVASMSDDPDMLNIIDEVRR